MFANNNPSWFGLLAPAKTPESEIRRLHQAVSRSLAEPAVKERFAQLALFASGGTPADLASVIQKELASMSRVAKFAKIRLD